MCLFVFPVLVHLFVLHCLLYWTSSNCVNIVISTLKFILIINFCIHTFIFFYLFRNLIQKNLGGVNIDHNRYYLLALWRDILTDS